MKLRTKLTLSFVGLVVLLLTAYGLAMDYYVKGMFDNFVSWKQVQVFRATLLENAPKECQRWAEKPSIERLPEICWKYIPIKKERGLTLFIQNGEFPVDSPEYLFIQAHKKTAVMVAVLGIVLAVLFAYLLSNFLLKKISRLQDSMNHYRQTGNGRKIEINQISDEIDQVSDAYNLLLEAIHKQERVRKEFFTDITHELRTPLTSIQGYLEGLIDGVYSPDKETHEKILKETKRLTGMVKEMTVLAKAESEKVQLNREEVDLKELSEEVIELFSQKLKNQESEVKISGEGKVSLDPEKAKQVMINLLDNAIQYGLRGKEILVNIDEDKKHTSWKITNQAVDLESLDPDLIFERFYRSDKSRVYDESKKHHLGIGLAIVKKIVEAHQGKVRAVKEGNTLSVVVEWPKIYP